MFACSTQKEIQYGAPSGKVGSQYIKSTILKLDRAKFNDKCRLNEIPSDLSYWYKSMWQDFETSEYHISYTYIKPADAEKGTLMNTYKTTLNISSKNDTTFILEIRRLYDTK